MVPSVSLNIMYMEIKRNIQVFSAKSVACLDKILNFAKRMSTKGVHLKNLCTRTDRDVQGVKSGSSILIMMNNESLSGFTSRIVMWIPLSCFLHYRVLPEPYSGEMWTWIHVTLHGKKLSKTNIWHTNLKLEDI